MSSPQPSDSGPVQAGPVQAEPERSIARDIVKRGLVAAPAWLLLTGLIWGVGGAASSAYGLALVLANLLLAAAIITHSVRISPTVLMAAVLGGFIVRIGLLGLAVFAVSGLGLFEPVPLAITILASHLGLLIWEMRYVSLALAQPGLIPKERRKQAKQKTFATQQSPASETSTGHTSAVLSGTPSATDTNPGTSSGPHGTQEMNPGPKANQETQ